MANPQQMFANAIQQGQAAIMSHPFAQKVAEGIKGLQQQQQQSAIGQRRFERKSSPMAPVPARPAPFAAILPGDSVGEVVLTTGLLNFLQLYNSALIVRLVLTWFPNPPAFIEQPLSTVCDPYLGLFRGIIPPLGGTIDLSPILAFVCLNFFTSSAQALPCEMGSDKKPAAQQQRFGNPFGFLQANKFQQAWERRVRSQRAMKESAESSANSQ